MSFPYDNWQFWVVTIAAFVGLLLILRPLLPSRKPNGNASGGACTNCPSGGSGGSLFRKSEGETTLTVLGEEQR